MTLPTREEISEILRSVSLIRPGGKIVPVDAGEVRFRAVLYEEMADALLARLRPGWQGLVDECVQRGELLDAIRADLEAMTAARLSCNDAVMEMDRALEVKGADLRACAEALSRLIGIAAAIHAKGPTAGYNDLELLAHAIDRAKEVSARPGVQAGPPASVSPPSP